MVYSKPLGGKSRIVKLVREMKKKIGSFTWAVLYMYCNQSSAWTVDFVFTGNGKVEHALIFSTPGFPRL